MNGLVYSLDDEADSAPVYWIALLFAAVLLHLLPLYYLTLPRYVPPPEDDVITITLDDSLLNLSGPISESSAAKLEPEAVKEIAVKSNAESALKTVPAPDAAKPAPVAETVEPPAVIETLSPADVKKIEAVQAVPVPAPAPQPKKEAVQAPAPKPLHDIDLAPLMNKKVDTAFDENSKVTEKAPKDGYFSDRNSTAADKGPKTLELGDPYIDKGESNIIRYMGKRGERDLPAFASEANSGSVQKEGSPIAGDGGGARAADFSRSVKSIEAPPPADPKPVAAEPIGVTQKITPKRPPAPAIPEPQPVATLYTQPPPRRLENDAPIPEFGAQLAVKNVSGNDADLLPPPLPRDTSPEPANAEPTGPKRTLNDQEAFQTYGRPLPSGKPAQPPPAARRQEELEGFMQELSGVSNSKAAGDGRPGTGANLRKGELGHEGNGSLRPGDANAVSDITTINLESSASEYGDPRFEKRFDARTAYIKSFARRIDNKWKADIYANLRVRLVPGTVSIRIVLRKDGKLMEASEAHRDRGIPDEYVSTARSAVKEAADPSADPFPPALSNRETIEYTFNFLYQ